MVGQRPSFLDDENLKLLLFGGKGGVGKTTTATATALYLARRRPEQRILVVSTDPAHSLSDSFDQPIGDEASPIASVPNLFALEMNASRRLEDFKRRYEPVLKTIVDRGTYFDEEDIADLFDLSLPGLDELVAIIEVANIVKDERYDLVALDTAPTGHTLRLLALPELMGNWLRVLDLMLEKHRYMTSVFGRARSDGTEAFLQDMSANLTHLRTLLSDADSTEFVPVTIPETMSIEETARLLEAVKSYGLRVRTVIVNRVITKSECVFCDARRRGQERQLEEIEHRFSGWTLVVAPLLPSEVRGQEALGGYIQAMLGDELPLPIPQRPCSPATPCSSNRRTGKADLEDKQRLVVERQQLILFSGKGGVGKTTIAAATAIHLARGNPGGKILLFSTDPAHSLSDSLDQQIGNQITPVADTEGLFALELDAAKLLEDLKRQYRTAVDDLFDTFLTDSFDAPFDRQVMEELITLTPPGLDEVMGLMKIMEFVEKGEFDRYILDMAPTGHALRFLETPGVVRKWLIMLFKLLLKYGGMAQTGRAAELLREKSKQLRLVQQLLIDPERCQFITVATPQAMVVLETARLLGRLAELSIPCRWVVVNMVTPPTECAFCDAVRGAEQHHLEKLRTLAPSLVQVPLLPDEVRGISGLAGMAEDYLVYCLRNDFTTSGSPARAVGTSETTHQALGALRHCKAISQTLH